MESNRVAFVAEHALDGARQGAMAPADLELLRRVAAGEELAFEELYCRYSRPLFTYVLRLVHEPSAAEELLQEVFLAVWRGAAGFRGRAQVRTWLYRIAHHRAVSWLRRYHSEAPLGDGDTWPSEESPPAEAMERWRADQVHTALARLSIRHRAVLELTMVHGFSYAEVAAVMGCPVGTVKSRMNQARRCLAQALQELGVDGS